jgi:predicted ATPase/DNA-binding CsgD family transcriptional regulator
MVGRESQLAALEQELAGAHDGRGGTVLLSGDAGIGKSRLTRELVALAESRRFRIVRGACFETDRQLPYAPVIELVRGVLAPRSANDVVRTGAETKLAPLSRLVPDLVPPGVERESGDPEHERRQLFHAVLELFEVTSANHPVLLIVEDLHWIDEASFQFLHFLARRLSAHPIMLVLTYRSDQSHPVLTHGVAELRRERLACELRLDPLTANEVATVLGAILQPPLPRHSELCDIVYRLTDGNPFFIEEVLGALVAAGDLFYADGRWNRRPIGEFGVPDTIHEAVRRRASLLSPQARRTLDLAAIAGRDFDFALLQALTHATDLDLMSQLRELISAQLVVEETTDHFAFRHALTRQAIVADMLGHDRRAVHAHVAEVVEQRAAVGAPDALIENLAHHWFEAGRWSEAIDCARRAGQRAQTLHAPWAAFEQFSRAVVASRELGLEPPVEVLLERGAAGELLGWFEQADSDYQLALTRAHATGDARSECEALLSLGLLWAGRDYDRAGEHYRRAIEIAQAIAEPVVLGRSLNRLGNWHQNQGRTTEALANHRQALSVQRAAGDARGIAETLDLLGMVTSISGQLNAAQAWFEQSIQLAREQDQPRAVASALSMLALLGGSYLHDTVPAADISVAAARVHLQEALRITRDLGWRAGEAYALLCAGTGLGPRGAPGEALDALADSVAIADDIAHYQWSAAARVGLGALHLDLLDPQTARHFLSEALIRARALGSQHWVEMSTALLITALDACGDQERSEELLRGALETDALPRTRGQYLLWCTAAEHALRLGDPERSLATLGKFAPTAGTTGLKSQQVPRLCKLRGEALLALRHMDEAEELLRLGRQLSDEREAHSLGWRIELSLGRVLRARRAFRDAEACFASVRGRVAELAHTINDASFRDSFLQRAQSLIPPERPASARRAAKAAAGGLTEREREVVVLVAEGRTNRQIAEQLVIAEHTVERHVENILGKLGLTSRVQIAAWATAKRISC